MPLLLAGFDHGTLQRYRLRLILIVQRISMKLQCQTDEYLYRYSAMPSWRGTFCHKYSEKATPKLAHEGGSFVGPPSGWYSASVPGILYVISYNIGPHYNGTRLYNVLYRYIPIIMHKVPALLGSVQVQGDFTHTLQTSCTGTGESIPIVNGSRWSSRAYAITIIKCVHMLVG